MSNQRQPASDSGRTRPPSSTNGRQHNTERAGDVSAIIGDIELEDEFADPSVDITHKRQTAEHEIVTGHTFYHEQNAEFVIQALGRQPPEITVTAWLTEAQTRRADDLVSEDYIPLETARYTGTVVPTDADIPHSRVFHEDHNWIFETTFDFLGVNDQI